MCVIICSTGASLSVWNAKFHPSNGVSTHTKKTQKLQRNGCRRIMGSQMSIIPSVMAQIGAICIIETMQMGSSDFLRRFVHAMHVRQNFSDLFNLFKTATACINDVIAIHQAVFETVVKTSYSRD